MRSKQKPEGKTPTNGVLIDVRGRKKGGAANGGRRRPLDHHVLSPILARRQESSERISLMGLPRRELFLADGRRRSGVSGGCLPARRLGPQIVAGGVLLKRPVDVGRLDPQPLRRGNPGSSQSSSGGTSRLTQPGRVLHHNAFRSDRPDIPWNVDRHVRFFGRRRWAGPRRTLSERADRAGLRRFRRPKYSASGQSCKDGETFAYVSRECGRRL